MRRMLLCLAFVLTLLVSTPAHAFEVVQPKLETAPLFDDEAGGDADVDDPAIWVHPTDRSRSRVIVTAKNGGLYVYDLKGRQTQHFATPPEGRFNNVDLMGDIAVVTDRGLDKLRFYRIGDGVLTDVTPAGLPWLFSTSEEEVQEQSTGYGLAVNGSYAVVSRRHRTELGLFRINPDLTYTRVDSFVLPHSFRLGNGTTWTPCAEDPGELPQAEGMVIDPLTGTLFAAQEDVGLWRIPLSGGRFVAGAARIVERTREFGVPYAAGCVLDWANDPGEGGRIASDVEGLTFHRDLLLVSSQGDNTFFGYTRFTNRPVAHFGIAGVVECDGAAAVATPLPGFPRGLLVVHNGDALPGGERPATNVKYVDAGRLPY